MPVALLGNIFSSLGNIDIQYILLLILVLCISLSFHEAAHAWAAYKLGDDTAYLAGRMSLNPLVHLDPIGSLVFLVTQRIGWAKPTPINPTRFDRKYSMKKGIVLTSIAGPASNLVLATASALIWYVIQTIVLAAGASQNSLIVSLLLGSATEFGLFSLMYTVNISLMVFNLLPVPPLDGYKAFGAALPGSLYYRLMEYERVIGLVFLFLVFFGRGILVPILTAIRWPFDQVIQEPLRLLFQWLWRTLGLAG